MVLAIASAPVISCVATHRAEARVVVTSADDRERPAGLLRFAPIVAVAYGSVFALVQLGLVVEYPGSSRDPRWALVATAVYLPLHLHHVYWAVQNQRAPAAGWTLALLGVVVAAALPVAGSNWLPVFAVVAVSALLVLPWPWSVLVAAAVVAAQAPLAVALHSPVTDAASYYVFAVWWRASALFVPIWLLAAIRQLEETRRSLANDAVVGERLRIEAELRRTVGAALDVIAARGDRALAQWDAGGTGSAREHRGGVTDLADEMHELVNGSRAALAQARQLISGYRPGTLAAEVDRAASLLTAAGIATRVELIGHELTATADPAVRSALHSGTADLLSRPSAGACVIRLTSRDGRVDVAFLTPDAMASTDPKDAKSQADTGTAGGARSP